MPKFIDDAFENVIDNPVATTIIAGMFATLALGDMGAYGPPPYFWGPLATFGLIFMALHFARFARGPDDHQEQAISAHYERYPKERFADESEALHTERQRHAETTLAYRVEVAMGPSDAGRVRELHEAVEEQSNRHDRDS